MTDLLQIKIEKAKSMLPPETRKAIDSVDWRKVIFEMKEKKGYNFAQLEDLELETELVLCGLSNPEKYQEILESEMKISSFQANELVKEMNLKVFKKIREELIKILENKESVAVKVKPINDTGLKQPESNKPSEILVSPASKEAKMHIENKAEQKKEETNEEKTHAIINSIPAQRLFGTFKTPSIVTNHTLENITKPIPPTQPTPQPVSAQKIDPYREIPGE